MTSNVAPTHPTDGPIHEWFSLSYTNYQVLHRTLMQSMPTEWQARMVACLEELRGAFAHIEQPEVFEVKAATERIVNEMTNAELRQAGVMADWYGGETFPGDTMPGPEFDEWRAQHETEEPVYCLDGEELDPHARVLIPTADPVPHYDRGRTYIEPRLPEPADADTLPAWLYQRFSRSRPNTPAWDQLMDEDRAYWEHQARAVSRAVARGGFKTTAEDEPADEPAGDDVPNPPYDPPLGTSWNAWHGG